MLTLLLNLLSIASAEVKPKVYLGIDLGTTFTCVSIYNTETNGYEFLNFGSNVLLQTLPSVVYIDKKTNYIGYEAIQLNKQNPNSEKFFYGFKRLVGLTYNDEIRERFEKEVTYKVHRHRVPNNEDIVTFKAKDYDVDLTPTILSSFILKEIYNRVTKDYEIAGTVVTTPAYFTVNQVSQTEKAAELAGFKKPQRFAEPTAACLDYAQNHNLPLNQEQKIMVFDLGGGTFDISIVEVENDNDESPKKKVFSNVTVTKYLGDNFLGGENINSSIYASFLKKIGKALTDNEKLRLRLFVEDFKIKTCVKHKEDPSAVHTESFFLSSGEEFSFSLNKKEFDSLADPVYKRIKALFFDNNFGLFRKTQTNAERDRPVSISEIQKIILVGGSTKIPYIKEMITSLFPKAELYDGIDPDKSVARGACIYCVNNDLDSGENNVMLLNVTTLGIGIAVSDGSFQPILQKDLTIPTDASQIFSTVEDNQSKITVQVAAGARTMFRDNSLIGSFDFTLPSPKPKGVPRIEIKIHMSSTNEITVTATDLDTNTTSSKVFKESYVGTDSEKVRQILEDAEKHKEADSELKKKLEALKMYEMNLSLYESALKTAKLTENEKLEHETGLKAYQAWINENKETSTSAEIEAQGEMLQNDIKQLTEIMKKDQDQFKDPSQQKTETNQPKEREVREDL